MKLTSEASPYDYKPIDTFSNRLMIGTEAGAIILVSEVDTVSAKGVVVFCPTDRFNVGYYHERWDLSKLRPYRGRVTLTQS